jgi:hypothetical protein
MTHDIAGYWALGIEYTHTIKQNPNTSTSLTKLSPNTSLIEYTHTWELRAATYATAAYATAAYATAAYATAAYATAAYARARAHAHTYTRTHTHG